MNNIPKFFGKLNDKYKTISKPSEGFFKDKGSKFFAFAFPVETEEEIQDIRQNLKKKYYDARHHVYAFRLEPEGEKFRASDDGEPSNSSGPPVLGQIKSYELTNILIVVIRYFGGTKLGIPGLINAYRTAAEDAIKNSVIITKTITKKFTLYFDYPLMNSVMRLAKEENLQLINQNFKEDCEISFAVPISQLDKVKQRLKNLYELKKIVFE